MDPFSFVIFITIYKKIMKINNVIKSRIKICLQVYIFTIKILKDRTHKMKNTIEMEINQMYKYHISYLTFLNF